MFGGDGSSSTGVMGFVANNTLPIIGVLVVVILVMSVSLGYLAVAKDHAVKLKDRLKVKLMKQPQSAVAVLPPAVVQPAVVQPPMVVPAATS